MPILTNTEKTGYDSAKVHSDSSHAPTDAEANTINSDPTGVTGADLVSNVISLTQANYDAIVTPDATTLYVITD